MADILADDNFKCIFLDENDKIRFEFHWNVFPLVQLTISQHWFRQWLGTEQTTSHYLNQCWHSSLTHICGTRGRWINANMRPLRHQVFSKALLCNKMYVVNQSLCCASGVSIAGDKNADIRFYFMQCILWSYGNVTAWNRFPHYWPFVRGIHRSPVVTHYKGPVMRSFRVNLNKR